MSFEKSKYIVWHCPSYLEFFFFSLTQHYVSPAFKYTFCPVDKAHSRQVPSLVFQDLPVRSGLGLLTPGSEFRKQGLRGQRLEASSPDSQGKAPSRRPPGPGARQGTARGLSEAQPGRTVRIGPGGGGAAPQQGQGSSVWPAIGLRGRGGGSAAAGPGVAPREPRAPRPSTLADRQGLPAACGRGGSSSLRRPPASRAAEPGSGRGSEGGGDCSGCSPAGLRARDCMERPARLCGLWALLLCAGGGGVAAPAGECGRRGPGRRGSRPRGQQGRSGGAAAGVGAGGRPHDAPRPRPPPPP